jgi:asparagine synthetase B (glutamine-hydrolysing)
MNDTLTALNSARREFKYARDSAEEFGTSPATEHELEITRDELLYALATHVAWNGTRGENWKG